MLKLDRSPAMTFGRWRRRFRIASPELPRSVGPASGKPRRRLKPEYSVKDFFHHAHKRGLSYVVLRWFEDLPAYDTDGDIDILIADEHLADFESFFVKATKGGARFDVYTVGGLSGTRYRGFPYYPPEFAQRLLDTRIIRRGNIPVPNDEMHFYSLAYHTIYQKHRRAGIPLDPNDDDYQKNPKHDYLGTLKDLGKRIDVSFEGTVRGLHGALVDYGVAPSVDTLRKLDVPERWLSVLFRDAWTIADDVAGFNVFVVRATAYRAGRTDEVCELLEESGFEIVFKHVLSPEEEAVARLHIRGGNWGGITRFPGDAGGPAVLIGTYDPDPIPVPRQATVKHPGLENYRLQKAKRFIRHGMNRDVPQDQWCSHVHSADGTFDAVSTLLHVAPGLLDEVKAYAPRRAVGNKLFDSNVHSSAARLSQDEMAQLVSDYGKMISASLNGYSNPAPVILGVGPLGGLVAEELGIENAISLHLEGDYGSLDRLRALRLPKILHGNRWLQIGAADQQTDVGLLFNDFIHWDDWGGYLRWAVEHCAQVYLDLPAVGSLDQVERMRVEHALQFIEWQGGSKLGSSSAGDENSANELYELRGSGAKDGYRYYAGKVMEGKGSSQVQDHYYIEPVAAATGTTIRPGTLNLALQEEVFLGDGISVPTGKGDYLLFPCKIDGMAAYIVKPPRARNGGWSFEIFSPLFLRKALALNNGDQVSVAVHERHIARSVDEVQYNVRARPRA